MYEALEFSAQMRVRDLDKQKLKDFVDQVGLHSIDSCCSLLCLCARALLDTVTACVFHFSFFTIIIYFIFTFFFPPFLCVFD